MTLRRLLHLLLVAALAGAVAAPAQAGSHHHRRHHHRRHHRSHRRTRRAAVIPACAARPAPASWQHVVWIVLENHSFDGVMGSADASYIRRLAAGCASATSYTAIDHPSLPNYIAMTSGDEQGIGDDGPPSDNATGAESIFSQLGDNWRAYEESMPAPCSLEDSGDYAVKHNPAAYYTGLRASCARNDLPLPAHPSLPAAFTFVTPNMCDDMHDCEVSSGDGWLRTFVPKLVATPEYRSGTTAIFITWDEDDGDAGNRVPLIALAPSIRPGTRTAGAFDHYSLLRTTEDMLGLPPLAAAASAATMRPALGL